MRKRVAFRALIIFLATAILLSSTGAYNILVYANQNDAADSFSANGNEQSASSASQPNITSGGGTLETQSGELEFETNSGEISWGEGADGTAERPYQISTVEHLLHVNEMVNDTGTQYVSNPADKYFILTADIDISSLTGANFIESTGSAYLVSANNASSQNVYINLDGNGHKITGGANGWSINVSGHENFALFGYIGSNSVINNVVFENINVTVSSASPREVAIISNKSDGQITNCRVNNCNITVSSTATHANPFYIVNGKNYYNGIAGVVADNSGTISGTTVSNFTVTLNGQDDYIGGIVGQNRGNVSGSTVSGIIINANGSNNGNSNIGGIAGLNATVGSQGAEGIRSCVVNMPGSNNYVNNFVKGTNVGGIVGTNEGSVANSSVTGSFSTASTPSATAYNMLGYITSSNDSITYYGGAVGKSVGSATISRCTVSDVGFFMSATTGSKTGYFGGITPVSTGAGSIDSCVATGTFAAQSTGTVKADCYAGGIIAVADESTAAGAISNCYALYKLENPQKPYVGAVIGWGGRAEVMTNCHWSAEISGSQSAYYTYSAANSSVVLAAEAIEGNLTAGKRCISVVRGSSVTPISASSLSHSWSSGAVTVSTPLSNLEIVSNKPANAISKQPYSTTLNMNGAQIGSSDKTSVPLSFNMDVFVTEGQSGDPGDIGNPLVISSSAQAKFISLAPYAHYKLDNDVSVSETAWTASVFTGTLDGNGHTITTECPIFTAVIGSRSGGIGATLDTATFVTNPDVDTAGYRDMGFITNLNVDLSNNISSGIFGNTFNSTFVRVTLTDGDPTADTGKDNSGNIPETGFTATLSAERKATFINAAYGYCYIYGCSTNVSTHIANDQQGNSYNELAVFIAYLSGEATIDNCYQNANVYIDGGAAQNTGRAAFIGSIANSTGYILNSSICSTVYISDGVSVGATHCYTLFNTMDGTNNSNKLKNIVWASNSHMIIGNPLSAIDKKGTTLWGGMGTAYNEGNSLAVDGVGTCSFPIPQNIDVFSGTTAGDFVVTSEDPTKVSVTGYSVEGNNLVINLAALGANSDEAWIKVYHTPSGMTTYTKYTIKNGLEIGADGYFHITSASDLKTISDKINAGEEVPGTPFFYNQCAYMLDANINMSFYDHSDSAHTFNPIGNDSNYFTGIFTAPTNDDGTPKYTISGLNISMPGSNVGLFGEVDLSGTVKVNDEDVHSHISNLIIDGANIEGYENVAVLVGKVKNLVTTTAYGSLSINNISVSNSNVLAGNADDISATGRYAAVIVASVENTAFSFDSINLTDNTVRTYYHNDAVQKFVLNNANGTSALGGVIGAVLDGTSYSTAITQTITDTHVSGLKLCGVVDRLGGKVDVYATSHAGGIIGSAQRKISSTTNPNNCTLKIGDAAYSAADGYDVTVDDSVIMVAEIAGGIVGISNAKTEICKCVVRGSTNPVGSDDLESAPMRIFSNTDLYIGGIAGYLGSYMGSSTTSYDISDPSKSYAFVSDCDVINTVVMATDPAISTMPSATSLPVSRNVAVGGIVGGINGYKTTTEFKGVENCDLVSSHVQGIAVGGIVGTGAERYTTSKTNMAKMVVHIGNCNVIASKITTPENCYPYLPATAATTGTAALVFGVGGIMGTNRRSQTSFAAYTTIEHCSVDKDTVIENHIPYDYTYNDGTEDITVVGRAATGGVLGSGFQNQSYGASLLLDYNSVNATIISPAQNPVTINTAYNYGPLIHTGTGGIVGMLTGFSTGTTAGSTTTGCNLPFVQIKHSVFGGEINSTDCIGGVIGSITIAYSKAVAATNLISDAVITGSFNSTSEYTAESTGHAVTHGGIAVGHIVFRYDGMLQTNGSYAINVADGTDLSPFFNNIYFSSYEIDRNEYPVLSYIFCDPTSEDTTCRPFTAEIKTALKACYTDVNAQDDEETPQYTERTISSSESEQAPITPQDNYRIAPGTEWQSNNESIVSVTTGANFVPTITPLHTGSPEITIEYSSSVNDGWARPNLKVGFTAKSSNDIPLDSVVIGGTTYYLIKNAYDFGIIGYDLSQNPAVRTSTFMGFNYLLADNIEIPDSFYDTGASFANGFDPIGTNELPFTGTFASVPAAANGLTTAIGETISKADDSPYTVSNLKLESVAGNAGMFGVVTGKLSQFSNFVLDGVSSTGAADCSYMGAVASKVTGPVSIENITITNASLAGADYTGGIFGGIFFDGTNTDDSAITSCTVSSSAIGARLGAAGIVVHTSQYYTNISGITVSNTEINQSAAALSATYDNGAAGICFAYSGTIAANGTTRNKVSNCTITGEVASGAVARTYTSASATAFVNADKGFNTTGYVFAQNAASATDYAVLSISAVDLEATSISGTYAVASKDVEGATNYWASAGILARVDASDVSHSIIDCTLDSASSVTASYAVGGFVGCFEQRSSSTMNNTHYGVTVDACKTYASLTTTTTEYISYSDSSCGSFGCGGVIGYFGTCSPLIYTNISNCVVGGTITGVSLCGGLIGAIWNTSLNFLSCLRLNTMSSHFASDCIVSAQFMRPGNTKAFGDADCSGVGIIVGCVYDPTANDFIFSSMVSAGFNDTNYPFYNIYFSEYNCPSGVGFLFGKLRDDSYSINYERSGGKNLFAPFSDYCYNLNDNVGISPENGITESTNSNGYTIDTQTHTIVATAEGRRIDKKNERLDGIINIDYINVNGAAYQLNLAQTADDNYLTYDTTVSGDRYAYGSNPTLNAFSVIGAGNTHTFNLSLVSVAAESPLVHVEHVSGNEYSITCDALTSTLNTKLLFTYVDSSESNMQKSNELKLYIDLKINKSSDEYWYKDISGTRTYLVFNANNLNVLDVVAPNVDVVQCFDVFWTLNDASVASSASSYAANHTIDDYINALKTANSGNANIINLLNQIGTFNCPNPDYNPEDASTPQFITFSQRFTNTATAPLSDLVGTIGNVAYGAYGEEQAPAIYNNASPFVGTYTSCVVPDDLRATVLNGMGDYCSIYGLDIRHQSADAGTPDAPYAGMFTRIGAGAQISNVTFVNPKVEIISSKTVDNYVGVLAGTVENATLSNITIASTVEAQRANGKIVNEESYVKNIRVMSPASSYAGGICGALLGTASISNFSISNTDVISSEKASNSGTDKRIYAGGVAGSSAGSIVGGTVSNCNICVERPAASTLHYMTYAGSIAGTASGTIGGSGAGQGITVSTTTLSGCEATVDQSVVPATGTYVTDSTKLVADRLGGIVGLSSGDVTITNCDLPSINILAFDIAAGIVAEVEDSVSSSLAIVDCNVGTEQDNADIRVLGRVNTQSGRNYYNAAAGVVGEASKLKTITDLNGKILPSLSITDCNFYGYAGTYSFDNSGKNCTAGGILGILPEVENTNGYLDNISIKGCIVQGNIEGYRKNMGDSTTSAMLQLSGAAGGIIGKIYNYGSKTFTSDEKMISDCVMSASVKLYTSVVGDMQNGKPSTPSTTNIGKIIGEVKCVDGSSNFAATAGTDGDSQVTFIKYVSNVYLSSYPEDINAYGCVDFYNNASNDPTDTFVDINYGYNEDDDSLGSFTVGSKPVEATDSAFGTDTYGGAAVITFEEGDSTSESSRHFRLKDSGRADITPISASLSVVSGDSSTATAAITTSPALTQNDGYHYGTLTVGNVSGDIVGNIAISYSYGLQAAVTFISMEIEGTGVESDPFIVENSRHFKVVRALSGAFYKQRGDIDLAPQYSSINTNAQFAEGSGFEPIGTAATPFTGTYDGDGYIIKNLYISDEKVNNIGFFGYVGTGSVSANLRNIHIELASSMDTTDLENVVTAIPGGIVGKQYVGGLVGYCKQADVSNCSVANGFVMGKTAVGGLVGYSGTCTYTSCFTSTNTYSYNTDILETGSSKTVGALIGTVGSAENVNNCFTLGFASVGTTTTSGSAGGLVGYVSSGTLAINNCFVGATVSDYTGIKDANNNTYSGLTVGFASSTGAVTAANTTVAATRAIIGNRLVSGEEKTIVNPILSATNGLLTKGATLHSGVKYDSDLIGVLNGTEAGAAQATAFSDLAPDGKYEIAIGNGGNAATDEYTLAYVEMASIPVSVSGKEVSHRNDENYSYKGLVYPISMPNDGTVNFVSSAFDSTDTVEYPANLDTDMYGNGESRGVKNTDVLFRDSDGKTTVYRNTYSSAAQAVSSSGDTGYNCNTPLVSVTKSATVRSSNIEITRTVVYPVNVNIDIEKPIATARQLAALGNQTENVAGSKFAFLYNDKTANLVLTSDINVKDYPFTPIVGFKGNLDGNGFTVEGLKIDMASSSEIGMFRTLEQGTIRDLCISVDTITGKNNVGALAGAMVTSSSATTAASLVRIENCSVKLAEGGTGIVATGSNVGSLVGAAMRCGDNSSKREEEKFGIYNSSSSVTVTGVDVVGGLVGYSEQPIQNSYATGAVNASLTSSPANVSVTPWVMNGSVPGTTTAVNCGTNVHGIGGLVGVTHKYNGTFGVASINACFGSGIVTVTSASYAAGIQQGVGGLVGIDGEGVIVGTSFSSGNVYYCYGDEIAKNSCAGATIGVGGLAGIINNTVSDVYSCASVAADLGDVSSATMGGVGGVVGIANGNLQNAYSSGATLGTTTSSETVADAANYGVGGVLGILNSGTECSVLSFDLNVSITDKVVGKTVSGSINTGNVRALTTAEMTNKDNTFMSSNFGYTDGAYPYLTNLFGDDVSLTIRINSLLSIVAIQLNPLDTSAANGEGISMALNIPTEIINGSDTYAYGFLPENDLVDAATAVIDNDTKTLSIQRTHNESQYVNCNIKIISKTTGSDTVTGENGDEYVAVANRILSRLCAPMLGTQGNPYLIATQQDLEHVGMNTTELAACDSPYYSQWVTSISSNGAAQQGKVYFRLMGYIPIDASTFTRTIPSLSGQVYNGIPYSGISIDGNGYSIRNLNRTLMEELDDVSTAEHPEYRSVLRNLTFENVDFSDNDRLITTVSGTAEGINVYGTTTDSNTAAIAYEVSAASGSKTGGLIRGCLADVDYSYGGSGSTNNIAGIAVTNNGTIELSASVGNVTSSAGISGFGALAVTNTGTIRNCFTIGNIKAADSTNIGGFVNNNSGTINNCYTRCNIVSNNTSKDRVIGSFAAKNSGEISGCYSSGLLNLNDAYLPEMTTVFVADTSTGTLTDCMYDKQLSGKDYYDIYNFAERTMDIVRMTNHPSLINATTGYTMSVPTIDSATQTNTNIYYPQLSEILNTYAESDGEETVDSRMYRVLRAYSFISSACAVVGNDNYIDNLPVSSQTVLSLDSAHNSIWSTDSETYAKIGRYPAAGNPTSRYINAVSACTGNNYVTVSAKEDVTDFYGTTLAKQAQLDIFATVTTGEHPNFAGGTGETALKAFRISNAEQFEALAFYGTNPENYFILDNDIDMSKNSDNSPFVWSTEIDNFKGNLNGDGKVVSNVSVSGSLLGSINGGTVTSLGIAGANVTSSDSSAGMLAATSDNAVIKDCFAIGMVSSSATDADVGGLVGKAVNTEFSGCIASGKVISSGVSAGGIAGTASNGSTFDNCLSTAFVSCPNGSAGGVLGSGDDTVTVTNAVFANNAVGTANGNIVGSGDAMVENAYYDEQFSTASGGSARSSFYLTSGATMDNMSFGTEMNRISGFTGYPVPSSIISGTKSENFMTGVKLASAKITISSGVGVGTINAFTDITAPDSINSNTAKFTATDMTYLNNVSATDFSTKTSALKLGDLVTSNLTYSLYDVVNSTNYFDGGKMLRYVELRIGKTIKVTYVFDSSLAASADATLTVSNDTGSIISAVTAFAVSGYHTGTLCNSMVFAPDDSGNYVADVNCNLPDGVNVSAVKAQILNSGSEVAAAVDSAVANGRRTLTFTNSLNEVTFDEIRITVTVSSSSVWGIRTLDSLV